MRSTIHRNRSFVIPTLHHLSNKLHYTKEFIVNVVIRHYKHVKWHYKCNRVPGMAGTLNLLIFYWVHSINMYSSGAWACIWCWTRLALFVHVQNDLYSTFIARFVITYEVLSLVMCTHILNVLGGSLLVSIKSFFAMFWLLNWMAWQHCVLLGLVQGWWEYMHSSF